MTPLPCPVCGGAASTLTSEVVHGSWVWCDDRSCCVTGPQRPTEAEAVAAWNRLASLPALVEALERVVAGLSDHVGPGGERCADGFCAVVLDKARAALALARGET